MENQMDLSVSWVCLDWTLEKDMLTREMSEILEGHSKHSWDTKPLFFQDEVYRRDEITEWKCTCSS